MRPLLCLFISLFLYNGTISASNNDVETFYGLVHRLMPQYESDIIARISKSAKDDAVRLSTENGKLIIEANDANSLAVGLNYYLKYFCHTTVSWYADDKFDVPLTLPAINKPVEIKARVKNRFFLNYCTFGYTMVWWDWHDWEHFIDWMALNGINLPLAITGQESIWLKVWTRLGLSADEVRAYFTGPAQLPWHRMLNLDRWGGPLPQVWLDDQEELQKQIVKREREFNMRPVLPAFSGHVPAELGRIFPKAKITRMVAWAGTDDYTACSYLNPSDPLYPKIQKMFMAEEIKAFGTDHIYGLDLFNEMPPPSYDSDFLARIGKQTYENLRQADKKATWLQMTWLFYNEWNQWGKPEQENGEEGVRIRKYVTSYPKDKNILLDYYCEASEMWKRTDKFYGVPYIWCYLGNFGGNTSLAGDLKLVNERIENTFKNGGQNFSGIGSTLEGFNCNPFMFEYVFEKAWDIKEHQNISSWVHHLADEHVGFQDENAHRGWDILINKVYNHKSACGDCSILNVRPAIDKSHTVYGNYKMEYDNRALLAALELIMKADSKTRAFTYDCVNLTRQLLSNLFNQYYYDYQTAYNNSDFQRMQQLENKMLALLSDLDELCGTEQSFLMGKWIADARKKGKTEEEKDYFESNARNLLTTWEDEGHALNDYASRTYNGLISTYYAERWRLFFAAVNKAFIAGEKFDDAHYDDFSKTVCRFEGMWWKEHLGQFPSKPKGDGISIAKHLVEKYAKQIK